MINVIVNNEIIGQTNKVRFSTDIFKYNNNINSVDLMNNDWVDNTWERVNDSMYRAFQGCENLKSVTNINQNIINVSQTFSGCANMIDFPDLPDNITFMYGTYMDCYNMRNAPKLPNAVTGLSSIYWYCTNLVNAPVIPNSVTSLYDTFGYCTSLENAPEIPNSVIHLSGTFSGCSGLVNAPVIPNSVTNMDRAFWECTNLKNVSEIPNSVTIMSATFYGCRNLVNAPVIPNSVNGTLSRIEYGQNTGIFEDCLNLTGNIFIQSENIMDVRHCFYNTELEKNVYIPFKYNNSGSESFNRLIVNNVEYYVNFLPTMTYGRIYEIYSSNGNAVYEVNYVEMNPDPSYLYVNGVLVFRNDETIDFNYMSNDYTNTPVVIEHDTNTYTRTYNSFINAGYSTSTRKDGALLKDINE